jgi:hypothetical protein
MNAWFDTEVTKLPEGEDNAIARQTPLVQRLRAVVEALVGSPWEQERRRRMAADLALYTGRGLEGNVAGLFSGQLIADDSTVTDGMAFNLCFGKVNTIRNRICSFRPRGQFLPQSGDRKAEQGAKDKTDMCDAWMKEEGWYALSSLATRDRLTCDSGWLKYFRAGSDEHERVRPMRVPPWEMLVDPMEALNGEPDCIYHVRLMRASQAAREFDIPVETVRQDAVNLSLYDVTTGTLGEASVDVIDAYYRGPDGRHVTIVGQSVAVDEFWEHNEFPFDGQVYDESETGYGITGASVVRVLRPLQEEVNEWELDMREAHHLTSQQVWLLEDGAPDPQVNNSRVRIQRYPMGTQPPTVVNPPAVNAEMYHYFETLDKQADKLIGISPFAQSGQGKPNVISKVAMREESELQTDRLALESQKNERMAVTATKWWWLLTRDICRDNPAANPKWKALDRGAWKEMVFGDLDVEYEITVQPTSLFGTGVSGQLDRANDLIEKGWLSREDAMAALHVPDLSPIVEVQLSEMRAMQEIVDRILEKGEYTTPDPYLCDRTKLNQYAAARYRIAFTKQMDYPKANLALLRKLIRATTPKPAAPAAAPGAMPTATGLPQAGPVAPVAATPGVAAPPPPTAPAGALVMPPGAAPLTA